MGTELTKSEREALLYKLAVEYYNLAEHKKNRDFAMKKIPMKTFYSDLT